MSFPCRVSKESATLAKGSIAHCPVRETETAAFLKIYLHLFSVSAARIQSEGMADPVTNGEVEEELVDYEEEDAGEETKAAGKGGDQAKIGYVGIHSSGFKDFLLKPELLRAIVDCGFEHPSEGEHPFLSFVTTCSRSLQSRAGQSGVNHKVCVQPGLIFMRKCSRGRTRLSCVCGLRWCSEFRG